MSNRLPLPPPAFQKGQEVLILPGNSYHDRGYRRGLVYYPQLPMWVQLSVLLKDAEDPDAPFPREEYLEKVQTVMEAARGIAEERGVELAEVLKATAIGVILHPSGDGLPGDLVALFTPGELEPVGSYPIN